MVQITAEELNRLLGLRGELDALRNQKAAELAQKEAERLKAVADKDGVEKALNEQRTSWEKQLGDERSTITKVRQRLHDREKAAVIAAALVGREFSGDKPEVQAVAASQFRALIEGHFEAYEDDQGNLIVRQKGTGRPAADVLKELVNAPEYQHFFAPKSRGGSGTDGTRSAGAQQTNPNENPHPIGTRAWYEWKALHANVGVSPMWGKPTQ